MSNDAETAGTDADARRQRRRIPSLAGDSAIYMVAGLVAKGVSLLTVPILTRSLGTSGYGLVDLATSTAFMLVVVATLGGDLPTAQRASRVMPEARPKVFGDYISTVAVASGAITLALLPASSFIAGTVWSSPDADAIAVWMLVLVPVSAVQSAFATVQRIRHRPRQFAFLQTIDLVAQMSAASALVLLGFGPEGAIVGLIVGSAVGLLAAAVASRGSVAFVVAPRRWSRAATLGAPYLPAALSFVIADVVARSQLADSHGTSSVGALGLAVRLASVIALAMSAFQFAWGPAAMARTTDEATRRQFARVLVAVSVVAASVSIAWSCVSPELIRILAGTEFRSAAIAVPGLALSSVIAAAAFILMTHAGVSGRSHHAAIAFALGGSVQVIVTGLLVGPTALLGVGIGALIGRGASLGMLAWSTWRALGSAVWTAVGVLVIAATASVGVALIASLPAEETLYVRGLIAAIALLVGAFVARSHMRERAPSASPSVRS